MQINYYSLNQYLDIVFRSRSHHFFVTVLPEEVQKAFGLSKQRYPG